jgi:hypothetical protein
MPYKDRAKQLECQRNWIRQRRLDAIANFGGQCVKEKTAKDRGYNTRPHGTLASYKRYGCRCDLCRSANADYEHGRRIQVRTYEVASNVGGLGVRLPDISTINPQGIQECVSCGDA